MFSVFKNFSRSLQVKFLLAYIILSASGWLISSKLVGLAEYAVLRQRFESEYVSVAVAEKKDEIKSLISSSNRDALYLWLKIQDRDWFLANLKRAPELYLNIDAANPRKDFAVVVNVAGEELASFDGIRDISFRDDKNLEINELAMIESVLRGEKDAAKLVNHETDETIFTVAPIYDDNQKLLGALFVRAVVPLSWSGAIFKLNLDWLSEFRFMVISLTSVGFIFSFYLARSLTKRLNTIAATANAWSVGDFTMQIVDKKRDELGNLTRRLNLMAIELNDYFKLKQELAAAHERNKLARDLHDSVKQQVFALSMQIGAARVLSNQENHANAAPLEVADKLAHCVQRELVDLINELRPQNQQNETLAKRLKHYVADWTRQTNITIETDCEETLPLAPNTEHAIYRIAQEGLANIARHSFATKATLVLSCKNDKLKLIITDDGRGFDSSQSTNGFGLQNMRERAEHLPEGSFKITGEPGKSTRITVECSVK